MATKLIRYQMPSRQMLTVTLPEGADERDVLGALDGEFSRLAADHKSAIEAKERQHDEATKALQAEVDALKGALAGQLVTLRKQRSADDDFNEKEETAYYMGLSASRLIAELAHERKNERAYTPSTRPAAFGVAGYAAPGVAWE